MQTRRLEITGMTCGHCVQAVKKSLSAVPGVTAVDVSLEGHEARVVGDADTDALVAAVQAQGYGARETAG